MHSGGLKAFAARVENRCQIYSYEQRPPELPPSLAGLMRKNKKAWRFFQAQPGYRRQMTWWIVSARTEATQLKRLACLIEASARLKRLR
jgi:hypothetical protein